MGPSLLSFYVVLAWDWQPLAKSLFHGHRYHWILLYGMEESIKDQPFLHTLLSFHQQR